MLDHLVTKSFALASSVKFSISVEESNVKGNERTTFQEENNCPGNDNKLITWGKG